MGEGELTDQHRGCAFPVAVVDVREYGFRTAVDAEDGLQVPAPEDLANGYDAHFWPNRV